MSLLFVYTHIFIWRLIFITSCLSNVYTENEIRNITEEFFHSKDVTVGDTFQLSLSQFMLNNKQKTEITWPSGTKLVFIYLNSSNTPIAKSQLSCGKIRIGNLKFLEADGSPFFYNDLLKYEFGGDQNRIPSNKSFNVYNKTFLLYFKKYNCEKSVSSTLELLGITAYSLSNSSCASHQIKVNYNNSEIICVDRSNEKYLKLYGLSMVDKESNSTVDKVSNSTPLKIIIPVAVIFGIIIIAAAAVVFIVVCKKTGRDSRDYDVECQPLINKPESYKYSQNKLKRIEKPHSQYESWGPLERLNSNGEWKFIKSDEESDSKWNDIVNKKDVGIRSRLILLPDEFDGLTIFVELKGMSRNNDNNEFKIRFYAPDINENESIDNLPFQFSVQVRLNNVENQNSEIHKVKLSEFSMFGHGEPDNFHVLIQDTQPELIFKFFKRYENVEEIGPPVQCAKNDETDHKEKKMQCTYNEKQQKRIQQIVENFKEWGPVESLKDNGQWIFQARDCEDVKWRDIVDKTDLGICSRLLLLPEQFHGLMVVVELKGMSRDNERNEFRIRFSGVSGVEENEDIDLPVTFSVQVFIQLNDRSYPCTDKHDFEVIELWGYAEPDDLCLSFENANNTEDLPDIVFQFSVVNTYTYSDAESIRRPYPQYEMWGPLERLNCNGEWKFIKCDKKNKNKWSDIVNKRDVGIRSRLILLSDEFDGLTIFVELKGMSEHNDNNEFKIRFYAASSISLHQSINFFVQVCLQLSEPKLSNNVKYRRSRIHEVVLSQQNVHSEPDNFYVSLRDADPQELPEVKFRFFKNYENRISKDIIVRKRKIVEYTTVNELPIHTEMKMDYTKEQQKRIQQIVENFKEWGPVESLKDNGQWIFQARDCENNKWKDIVDKTDLGIRSRLLLLPEQCDGLMVVVELKGMSRDNERNEFRIRFSGVSGIKENEEDIGLPVSFSVQVFIQLNDRSYRHTEKQEFKVIKLWGYAEPDDLCLSFENTNNTEDLPDIVFQFFDNS